MKRRAFIGTAAAVAATGLPARMPGYERVAASHTPVLTDLVPTVVPMQRMRVRWTPEGGYRIVMGDAIALTISEASPGGRLKLAVRKLRPLGRPVPALFHPDVLAELAPGMTLEEFASRPGCFVIKPDDDA